MEQNLPFVKVGIIDDNYNNRVLPFLGKIDNGHLFKWVIVLIWRLLSYALLLGGIYLTFAGIAGDEGYLKLLEGDGLSGGQKAGAIVGLILGVVISLVCAWFLYSLVKKRTSQLEENEYNGLLEYLTGTLFPRLITLIGEIGFTLFFYMGLMQICATLVGSYAYAPIVDLWDTIMNMVMSLSSPGLDMVTSLSAENPMAKMVAGSYDNFGPEMQGAIMIIVTSFLYLIYFYALKQIYNYALSMTHALIRFIPRLALPIAIRTKND